MIHNKINKSTLIALAINCSASPLIMAATYNPQSETRSIYDFSPLESQSELTSLFLDPVQQQDTNIQKKHYIETLDLIKENKLLEAKLKIDNLIQQAPNEPENYNLQALLATQEKNSSKAQKSYQKAIKLDAKNLIAHLGLAKLALDKGDLLIAKEYSEKSLIINDKSVSAYLLLAEIANTKKNVKEAENILLTAIKKVKYDAIKAINLADNLAKFYAFHKQPEKILTLSENLLKQYPNNKKMLSMLAKAQILNNQTNLAEQSLQQLINQDKQDIGHRLLLARILINQQKNENNILKLLNETSAIDPNDPRAPAYKAAYLIQLNRYKEALKITDELELQFPKLMIGKLLKADVYLAEKKFDKALNIKLQAYQIEPNERLLSSIISLMNMQGQLPKAVELLKQELTKKPNNNAIHFELAILYQKMGNLTQATKHYQAVLNKTPKHAVTLNNLAWIYVQQGNPQALQFAKKAYSMAPESANITDTYGYILLKQGQNKEGLKILLIAEKLSPKQPEIQFHLAQAYSANNDTKQAIATLKPIVVEGLTYSEKESAISLLKKLTADQ